MGVAVNMVQGGGLTGAARQEQGKSPCHDHRKSHLGDPREFACGWGAAFINISLTFPINKLMFRQQLYGVRLRAAVGQLKKEGLPHLYRGLLPPLLQKTTSMSLMFGMYDLFRDALDDEFPHRSRPANHAMAAMLAGFSEAILTPFERVQTLMLDKTYQNRFNNTLHAFRDVRTYGYREFYRGIFPILVRNGISNVLFFGGREKIRELLPPDQSDSPTYIYFKHFMSGAFLGAFISTIFYPINVVKTRMQSHLGGKHLGVVRTVFAILHERDYSIKKLFRGVHLNYTRSFLSWGIVNASYELLHSTLYKV